MGNRPKAPLSLREDGRKKRRHYVTHRINFSGKNKIGNRIWLKNRHRMRKEILR